MQQATSFGEQVHFNTVITVTNTADCVVCSYPKGGKWVTLKQTVERRRDTNRQLSSSKQDDQDHLEREIWKKVETKSS